MWDILILEIMKQIKAMIKMIFLGGIIVLTAFSCEKEGVEPLEIPVKIVSGLSVCGDSCFLIDAKYKDTRFVINSQSEYESLFECNFDYELPIVDFSIYTLLAGSQAVGGIYPAILSQQVLKYSKNNTIIYEVQIKEGGYAALGSAYYHALIPKIEKQYNMEFIVTVEPFVKNN